MRRTATRLAVPLAVAGGTAALLYLMNRSGRPPHPADSAPGRAARRGRFGDYVVTGRSVTIDAARGDLFARLKDPAQLGRFMQNVRAVEKTGDGNWRWTLAGPAGSDVRLETRIVQEDADSVIAWRSTGGSQIDAEGKIMLRDAPGGRGTVVEAIVAYQPPGGAAGHWVAKAFLKDPKAQGRHELKRLKMLVETGEIATSENRREGRA